MKKILVEYGDPEKAWLRWGPPNKDYDPFKADQDNSWVGDIGEGIFNSTSGNKKGSINLSGMSHNSAKQEASYIKSYKKHMPSVVKSSKRGRGSSHSSGRSGGRSSSRRSK